MQEYNEQTHSSVENRRNHREFHILRQLNSKSFEKLIEDHQIQLDISLVIVAADICLKRTYLSFYLNTNKCLVV